MKKRLVAGFTLIELMIAITLASLLMSLAGFGLHHFIQHIRLINATQDLHNAMNLTRMEAIKRNAKVDLVARNNSWKNGWIIMADNQAIFQHDALSPDIEITSTFKDKKKHYIAYNGAGRTRTDANNDAALSGSIRLSIGKQMRVIVINFLGRVRVCNPTTASTREC